MIKKLNISMTKKLDKLSYLETNIYPARLLSILVSNHHHTDECMPLPLGGVVVNASCRHYMIQCLRPCKA